MILAAHPDGVALLATDSLGESVAARLVCAAGGEATGRLRVACLPRLAALATRARTSLVAGVGAAGRVEAAATLLDASTIDPSASQPHPYPFQSEGSDWLAARTAAILADEMGLGKTVQTLCALSRDPSALDPVLVVCPATLKRNWQTEALRWAPAYAPRILAGRGSFEWPERGEIVITNYDVLPSVFGAPHPWSTVIADEAQALKNHAAKRTQSFRLLAARVRRLNGAVWLLSGTPVQNKPPELWALLRVLDLHRVCFRDFNAFAHAFGATRGAFAFEWLEPERVSPAAMRPIAPYFLRRTRAAVLPDLPPKRYRVIEIPAPAAGELADTLSAIDVDAALAGIDQGLTVVDVAGLALARKDLAAYKYSHPIAQALIDSFADAAEPLVLFSAHRQPVIDASARAGWLSIYGDRTAVQRDDAVNSFQTTCAPGIACTIATAGYGLTLTRAAHALFVDQAFTPAANLQAEDRIVRIGQTRGTLITVLVCDHPLDKRIHEILRRKAVLLARTTDTLDSPHAPRSLANTLRRHAQWMNTRAQ